MHGPDGLLDGTVPPQPRPGAVQPGLPVLHELGQVVQGVRPQLGGGEFDRQGQSVEGVADGLDAFEGGRVAVPQRATGRGQEQARGGRGGAVVLGLGGERAEPEHRFVAEPEGAAGGDQDLECRVAEQLPLDHADTLVMDRVDVVQEQQDPGARPPSCGRAVRRERGAEQRLPHGVAEVPGRPDASGQDTRTTCRRDGRDR